MADQERPPTEEELRAYEAQLKLIRVDDVIVQTVVSLVNLGGRKAGLAPGTEDERDFAQVRQAIEGVRVLLPLVEAELGPDAARIREAVSQLQMVYAQSVGQAPPEEGAAEEPPPAAKPGEAGPAQSSGRLWIPGQ
jgi:hypothetical protein